MNMKNEKNRQQIILTVGLILSGIIGRYLLVGAGLQPFPNFEVIMVMTFLAIMLIRSPLALIIPLVSMIGSDLLIGNPILVGDQMNRIVLFTYSGFAIIALLTLLNKNQLIHRFDHLHIKSIGLMAGLGAGSVLLYDIWTNMGWWYLMYPHDASSLALVHAAGIPFMIYHLISGIVTFIAIGLPIMVYATKKKDIIQIQPLKLRTIHKIPAVLLVISLIVLSFTGTAMKIPQKTEVWVEKSDQTSVRILVISDSWTITNNLVAYEGDTAFSLLERCAKKNGFPIESTYYAQYNSTLINAINNIVSGTDGKYWQFYVNEQPPTIGADQYLVKNGDLVRWSFETISM